jgi:phosphoglycolate phosphatase-like HAD superfamily hydrolase
MTLPKCMVLDLDGPILEGVDRHHTVYREILLENGFQPLPRDAYWELKKSLVNRRQMLAMSQAETLYDAFLRAWLARIELKQYLQLDTLQPGVLEVLHRWRERGIRLILATMRSNEAHLHWQLQELGLREYFADVVVVAEPAATHGRIGQSKAAGVRGLVEGLPPDSVIWVGDTEADMQAAQELGVRSAAVLCGLRTEAFLRTFHPDTIVRNLPELAVRLEQRAD